jgi:KTSC domain-containing protein
VLRVSLAVFLAMLDAIPAASCAEPSNEPSHIVSRIPRQPVQSTAIAKVGYSKRRHILEIEFVNGAVYRYFDVPPAIYRGLMSAGSKAQFYDFNVKGHYRSIPIPPLQKQQVPAKNHSD